MRRRRLNLKDASGATAFEFALICPALFMMIAGGVQFAWMLHCAATVRWSLETNARNLLFNPAESASTLKTAMVNQLKGKASAQNLTVTITQAAVNGQNMLVATSVYQTTLAVPFLNASPMTFTSVTRVPTT